MKHCDFQNKNACVKKFGKQFAVKHYHCKTMLVYFLRID